MTGWIRRQLRDVTTKIGSGATPLGGEAAYKREGVKLIRSLNVHDTGFRTKDLAFLDDAQAANLDNVVVELGDVLLNITGASIARCCVAPDDVTPARVNQHVMILRPRREQLLPELLHYLLISPEYKNRLLHAGEGAGATRQALTKAQVQDFWIHFPESPPEQRRIVGILDSAFAGIATAKANAEKNRRNAEALFESQLQGLFTQSGQWTRKKLAEVGKTFGRGKSRHRPRNEPRLYGGQYPFIQTGDVRNAKRVVESYSQTYSELGLAQSKLWPAGTVCITIAANIAETAILGFDACIPDSIIGLVVDETKADNVFVLYLLRSFKARLQAQGKGSAQHNINMGTFEDQAFPFPELRIQRRIVAQLDKLVEGVQRLESVYRQKQIALEELQKSLLHQAFNGGLRERALSAVKLRRSGQTSSSSGQT